MALPNAEYPERDRDLENAWVRVGGTERALPLATDDERFLLLVDSLLFLSIPLLLCPRAVVALPRRDIGRPLLPVDLIFRSNLLLLPSPLDFDL